MVAVGGGAALVHDNQLIQHRWRTREGDFAERNRRTRNLAPRGRWARALLFLFHNDTLEHVLHHTRVGDYARPVPGRIPMPPEAVRLSVRGYQRVLRAMPAARPAWARGSAGPH